MNDSIGEHLTSWFELSASAIVILQDSKVVELNRAAKNMFAKQLSPSQTIDSLFPDFSASISGLQTLKSSKGVAYRAEMIRQGDSRSALLIIEPLQETNFESLAEYLDQLHIVNKGLAECSNAKAVYRYAVEASRKFLGIDRMGILLIDHSRNEFTGTYGTNEEGEVVPEFDYRAPIPDSPWAAETLTRKDSVAVWEDMPLLYKGKKIGLGWNAMAALWDGDMAIGWIACDNLLNQQPMTPALREAVRSFASLLAQAIVRKRAEEELTKLNESLERLVNERTQSLERKVIELHKTQRKLTEAEKRAALATLVVGVAHEINTPLGAVVSNIGSLQEVSADLLEILQEYREALEFLPTDKQRPIAQKESLFDLDSLIDDFPILVEDIRTSLKRMKAVTHDLQGFSSSELTTESCDFSTAFKHVQKQLIEKGLKIEIDNRVNKLELGLDSKRLEQVLLQLLSNAEKAMIDNGNENESVVVTATKDSEGFVCLQIIDYGIGMSSDVLHRATDPFYSTRKEGLGTGLGLSVVESIVNSVEGRLELDSTVGTGTRVSILLPGKFC